MFVFVCDLGVEVMRFTLLLSRNRTWGHLIVFLARSLEEVPGKGNISKCKLRIWNIWYLLNMWKHKNRCNGQRKAGGTEKNILWHQGREAGACTTPSMSVHDLAREPQLLACATTLPPSPTLIPLTLPPRPPPLFPPRFIVKAWEWNGFLSRAAEEMILLFFLYGFLLFLYLFSFCSRWHYWNVRRKVQDERKQGDSKWRLGMLVWTACNGKNGRSKK